MYKANLAYTELTLCVYFQMQYSLITSEQLHYTQQALKTQSLTLRKFSSVFLSLD